MTIFSALQRSDGSTLASYTYVMRGKIRVSSIATSEASDGARVASRRRFEVICAGEARWNLSGRGGGLVTRSKSLRFQPGGGAVNTAYTLAQQGVRVGLATALADDMLGRSLLERVAAAGVDVGGAILTPPSGGLVFVETSAASRQLFAFREEELPIAIPPEWSSQVLLLSGLTPVVSQAAALCKAARAARRDGTLVVIDVNAKRQLWIGRDPRAVRMVLREADVVRCTAEDLAVLAMDVPAIRAPMRADAILVVSGRTGATWAIGPFGEVAMRSAKAGRTTPASDPTTALICAELVRDQAMAEASLWERVLSRGQAVAAGARAGRGARARSQLDA